MTRFARVALAALAVVLACGGTPAFAYSNTPAGAQRDCGAGHNPLTGHYTVPVLEKALATLPTSDAQYSTCVDALRAAIKAAERAVVARHTTTTSTTATPATHHGGGGTKKPTGHLPQGATGPISEKISAAVTQGRQPQSVGGSVVTPGAITTRASSFLGSIPTPILAVLAALIAALGALGGLAVRNVVRARRTG